MALELGSRSHLPALPLPTSLSITALQPHPPLLGPLASEQGFTGVVQDQEYQHPWGLVRKAHSQVEPQTPGSGALRGRGGGGTGPSAYAAALQGLCWALVLGTPGSRAYPTPLPGTCSSSFGSCFNLDFRLLSFHAFHFPTAWVTVAITDNLFFTSLAPPPPDCKLHVARGHVCYIAAHPHCLACNLACRMH